MPIIDKSLIRIRFMLQSGIFISLIMLTFLGCKKDPCDGQVENDYHMLSNSDSFALPYSGLDTLYFEVYSYPLMKVTDTIKFCGQSKQYSYPEVDPGAIGGCPKRHYAQSLTFVNKAEDINSYLNFAIQTSSHGSAYIYTYYATWKFQHTVSGIYGFYGYSYDNHDFGGKTYYQISSCSTINGGPKGTAYFNVQYGLLQLTIPNEYRLTLLSK